MNNYNRNSFIKDLQSIDWEIATSAASDYPYRMVGSFYDLFLAVLDVHAPLKIRKIMTRHAHAPWISQGIKNLAENFETKADNDPLK